MPTVPRRNPSAVTDTAPLPGVRFSPEAPTAAFQPPAPIDLSGLTRHADAIFSEERDKADQLAVLDADNQLSTLSTDLGAKARSLKGKGATNALPLVNDGWKQGTDKIAATLTSDRQRTMFKTHAANRYDSLYGSVVQHTEREHEQYDTETTDAAIQSRINDAIADPLKASVKADEVKAIIGDYGRRQGLAPEVVDQRKAIFISKLHSGVLDQITASGDDLTAREYFAKYKGELVGKDLIDATHMVNEGSVRGESQRQADQILKTAETLTDAVTKAREIKDPDVRDATETRVRSDFAERSQNLREQREQMMTSAGNYIDHGRPIPPSMWVQFSPSEKSSLLSYQKARSGGSGPDTDWTVYSRLQQQAGDENTRQKFLETDPMTYRSQLGDTEFKQIVELRRGLTEKDQSAEAKVASHAALGKVVNSTLLAAGINPSLTKGNKQAADVGQFWRATYVSIDQFEQQHKRRPTTEEMQGVVDNLLVTGTVAGGDKRRVFQRAPGDQFILTIKDVPSVERANIETILRKLGKPVTDAAIVRYYGRAIQHIPVTTP